LNDPSAQEDDEYVALFRFEDKRGKYNEVALYMPSLDFRKNQRYFVQCPDGSKVITPPGKVFRWTQETLNKNIQDDRVVFKKTKTSPLIDQKGNKAEWNIYTKIYLHERLEKGLRPATLLDDKEFTNSAASKELIRLGVEFPFTKPWQLMSHLCRISGTTADDIILDFFAGSGSMGQGVMKLNASDEGKRRYILVQLPEVLDIDDKAQKDEAEFCDKLGRPRILTEITRERLRRASQKIAEEAPLFTGDMGFRVFKLDTSNIRAWDPRSDDIAGTLDDAVEHLKADRGEQDILFELLLKLGLELTVPVEEKKIAGKTVYNIGAGTLMACLDAKIVAKDVDKLAHGIAEWHKALVSSGETIVVFRDSAFADDVAKTNLTAIIEQAREDRPMIVRSL